MSKGSRSSLRKKDLDKINYAEFGESLFCCFSWFATISIILQDEQQSTGGGQQTMGGPSLWNSNLVSNLGESQTSPANTSSHSNGTSEEKPIKAKSSKRSNKSKSKLSRVRYFLHPGEPPVGQIVSDSLTDGQPLDNNNTLSLKQPQVILSLFVRSFQGL